MPRKLESLHMQLRKMITRGHFQSDEAALKLIWLALRNVLVNGPVPSTIGARRESVRACLFRKIKQWNLNINPPDARNSEYLLYGTQLAACPRTAP